MFASHMGVAFAAKAIHPYIPFMPLLWASFLLDALSIGLHLGFKSHGSIDSYVEAADYTNSLVAVLLFGMIAFVGSTAMYGVLQLQAGPTPGSCRNPKLNSRKFSAIKTGWVIATLVFSHFLILAIHKFEQIHFVSPFEQHISFDVRSWSGKGILQFLHLEESSLRDISKYKPVLSGFIELDFLLAGAMLLGECLFFRIEHRDCIGNRQKLCFALMLFIGILSCFMPAAEIPLFRGLMDKVASIPTGEFHKVWYLVGMVMVILLGMLTDLNPFERVYKPVISAPKEGVEKKTQ